MTASVAVATGVELTELPGGGRVGVVDPTPERLALAEKIVARGRPWRGRRDIWFSPSPMLAAGGGIAFVFPGLEADFAPQVDDVAALVGMPVPELSTKTVGRHAAAVFGVGELLDAGLRRIGVRPDAVAGHSAGEWQAMRAGGIVARPDFDTMIAEADLDALVVPGVEFAVLGCSAERARRVLTPGLVISHDNAPNQTVVCGPSDEVDAVLERLRADGVICQPLPFRSGFHTPMLQPFLGPFIARGLPSLPMRAPSVPVWSATLAQPFPAEPEAIRALSVRQLIEPVRFRELVLNMHAAGIRVFVQVGTGQLGSLIEDTLRAAEQLTVVANSPHRTGIDQLRRVATAVWVEGGTPDFAALEPAPVPPPDQAPVYRRLEELARGHSFAADLKALLDDMTTAVADVIEAAEAGLTTPVAADSVLQVSTAAMPYLLDHCLSAQRPNWPDETDRRPVVPATTMIAHMIDAALAAAPGRVAAELTDVRFRKWLVAAPAERVPITVRPLDTTRVAVQLGEFAEATVRLATAYRPADGPAQQPLGKERAPGMTAEQVYSERWMFHGPAFQGVTRYTGISDESISGQLTVTEPPGALLDAFGQLLGLWMTQTQHDRPVALPAEIKRIVFHQDEPRPGRTVDATVRVTALSDERVAADGQVSSAGTPLITVSGWQDFRMEGNWDACTFHRFPDRSTLSRRAPGGPWLLSDPWRSVVAREFYLSKYLGAAERADYLQLTPPQRWRWLAERIAIKDAVRGWLWDHGHGPIYPAELQVWQDTFGAYRVTGMHGLRVPQLVVAASKAHELTAAVVGTADAAPVAIEVAEVVEASLHVHKALSRDDEALLDQLRQVTGDALPVALARLAAARSVSGAPRVVQVDGSALVMAGGLRIATGLARNPGGLPERQYVIAWTGGQP